MELEWDERKRLEVIAKRGVDILYAALIFEGAVLMRQDTRADYREDRFISLGLVDGDAYVVVHTERNGVTRLITAWKGGQRDRQHYQARIAKGLEGNEGSG